MMKNNNITDIDENQIWNEDKLLRAKEYIKRESEKQSPQRKFRNELLAIKYQIQDYIENDAVEKEMRVLDFVKLYLRLLKITQKDLAKGFEMKESNLHKYFKGERKLNPDIVFKLSAFSHTQPELWYYLQTKNELFELRKEKSKLSEYQKYDYVNLVSLK